MRDQEANYELVVSFDDGTFLSLTADADTVYNYVNKWIENIKTIFIRKLPY